MFSFHFTFLFFRHHHQGSANMPQECESSCESNLTSDFISNRRQRYFRIDSKSFNFIQVNFQIILYHHRSRLEFKTSSSCKNVCTRWYASVCYLAGIIYFVSFVYPVSGTVMTDQINKGTHLEWRVYCKNKRAFNTKSLKVR